MKILDRYIIRFFLLNFVILLTVLAGLFTIVNVLIDLDEFLDAGQVRAEQFGGSVWLATAWSVWDFNSPLLVLLYVFFSGLLVVAAMGFTFSGLCRTGELSAMVSSGISLYRVVASVVVVGAVLNALAMPLQEFVIPRLATKLGRSPAQMTLDEIRPFEIHYASDDQGNLLSAREYQAGTRTLDKPRMLLRSPEGVATGRVTAQRATWDEQRGGWALEGGWWIPFDQVGFTEGEAVSFLPSRITPNVLLARQAAHYSHFKSIRELQRMLDNPVADHGRVNRVIHGRFSLLVMNILVLVMGLPFFLLTQSSNVLLQAVKAAGVCLTAWGAGLFLVQAGPGMGNPVASAWMPVVIYLPISAVMLLRIRT